jgi:hypothetical protein
MEYAIKFMQLLHSIETDLILSYSMKLEHKHFDWVVDATLQKLHSS